MGVGVHLWFFQFYLSDCNKLYVILKPIHMTLKPTRQRPSRVNGLKIGRNNRTMFSKISLNCVIVGFCCLLFVCLGLTSLWNIWGHITTVPACSSNTLTNVLPHRNAVPQTQDMASHPVTVYRHGADLSLCYLFMWNVTLEYTATHFNVLGETRPGIPSPAFHTHQRTLNLMLLWWSTVGSLVENTVPTGARFLKKDLSLKT